VRSWILARLITLSRLYLTFLFGWAILHALFGDRWWWLFALDFHWINWSGISMFGNNPANGGLGWRDQYIVNLETSSRSGTGSISE
jgi:hypothetical protein